MNWRLLKTYEAYSASSHSTSMVVGLDLDWISRRVTVEVLI